MPKKNPKHKSSEAPLVLQLGMALRGDEITATNPESPFFSGSYVIDQVSPSQRFVIAVKLGSNQKADVIGTRISEFEFTAARFVLIEKEGKGKR